MSVTDIFVKRNTLLKTFILHMWWASYNKKSMIQGTVSLHKL